MKEKKVELRFYSVPEWEKEQEYLRERHSEGWKFIHVGFPGIYHFERCEPEDVVYQLDYNPEGLEHKSEYVQMFEDCGWEYLEDYAGYSYFRKPVAQMKGEREEGIFCDTESRMEMIQRVFRGRIVPLILIFLFLIVGFIDRLMHYTQGDMAMLVVHGVLVVLYISVFVTFAYRYWEFKRRSS